MAKTTGKAGKRSTGAGRAGPRAHKPVAPKAPKSGSRKAKMAGSASRKRQPAAALETARLKAELKAANMQQQASAEILRAVAHASGELGPVFKTVLESATRICDAGFGTLLRFDGNAFYFA